MDDSTKQQPAPGENPGILRDVLGGDEGKTIPAKEAVNAEGLEKPVAPAPAPQAPATPPTEIPDGFVPSPSPARAPETTPAGADAISVMPENNETIARQQLQEEAKTPEYVPATMAQTAPAPAASPVQPNAEVAAPTRPAIRTLHSDVARSVQQNDLSISKIALAQQEKNARLGYVGEEKPGFWSAWSVGAILLGLAGVALLGAAGFFLMQSSIVAPFVNDEAPAPTLVPVVARQTIDTTRMTRVDLIREIRLFMDKDYSSPVALEALILEERVGTSTVSSPLGLERFFERLGTRAPGRLVRSLGPDMTVGRAGATPFIITTSSSYEASFAGMLEWESAMADDLPFVTFAPAVVIPDPEPVTSTTEAASTTPASSAVATSTATTTDATSTPTSVAVDIPPAPTWKDVIVRNKDARALFAHDGTLLLIYAFPSEDMLVITQTKEALTLIVDALNAPVFGS